MRELGVMKYILFIFCISMLSHQSVYSQWASNKVCAPAMNACMTKYSNNHGKNFDTPAAKAAHAGCMAEYDRCAKSNGVIKQGDGSYAQLYHPDNPDYIACKNKNPNVNTNSEVFRKCMNERTRPKPAPAKPPDTVKKAAEPTSATVASSACSKTDLRGCKNEFECRNNYGVWDGTNCKEASCPAGTIEDPQRPEVCKCSSEIAGVVIDRGSQQQCPSSCKASDNKVYDPLARGCVCNSGFNYQESTGRCVAKNQAAPVPQVAECLRELQEKVTSCDSAASTAVDKCDPKRENGEDDSVTALQGLLGGVNGYVQAKNSGTGAIDNCVNAGMASSTGYYALEELRDKCDVEINSCKTSCSDATSYLNANKDRFYQACRKKAWDDHSCQAPGRTPYQSYVEEEFNIEWDNVNKAAFERQIQEMQTHVADNNTKCETGTAISNRQKMSDFMLDMNDSVKSASQCQCQLSSSGQNCEKLPGPAECAINPALVGCAQATINCLSANDNSQRCACFRNPNSNDCKKIQQVNNAKLNSTEASSFAGVGGSVPIVNGINGGNPAGKVGAEISGDLSGINANGEAVGSNSSGTTTSDAGSPFGSAAGGSAGGGSFGGGGSGDPTATGAASEDEGSGNNRLNGFFNTAKSALGNLFKKGPDDKRSFNGINKNKLGESNEPSIDSKKWRPRGMVRGLAGDTEIAGKFEDIWKVMNRQYKIQDQKDQFLFGGEKK